MRSLGELFEIGAGKTMSAAAREGTNKTPFLRTSNVLWDEIDLTTVDEMAIPADELDGKLLRAGDLLVCEGGEIGRAAVWHGRIAPLSFQNHLHRLRPLAADVEPRFYVYFLQCGFTQLGIFEGAGNTTTIPNLSRNRLAALEVPHPSIEEQRVIANALRMVRDIKTLHQRIAELASELKSRVMQTVFARGLSGDRQKDTDLGSLPQTWQVMPLGSLGRIGNGSTPKRSVAAYWENGDVPWLNSGKVYNREIYGSDQHVTDVALKECHLPIVKPSAVLIAITGQGKTLGHCAVLHIEATVSQHVAYIQVDPALADPGYVRGYLETQYDALRQVASGGGSTKGALTCSYLRNVPIPLPPLDEQQRIVAVLDGMDRKIALHRRKTAILDELFKSLLHKLMTGQIRVDDLDTSAIADGSLAEMAS